MKTTVATPPAEQGAQKQNNVIPFPQDFSFDPKSVGLARHIADHADYGSHKIPTCEHRPKEPEVKWIIPSDMPISVYGGIYNSFAKSPFPYNNSDQTMGNSDTIEFPVFLADNKVNAREALLSFGKDTLDYDIMRHAGEQVRARGPFLHRMADSQDPFDVFSRGQGTIKELFSKCANGEDRVELEAKKPVRNIAEAALSYIKENLHRLHDIYKAVANGEKDLYVAALCYSPRASFHVITHLPQHNAFVEFEVCCDPNTFFTPHGDIITGQDLELEYEAKTIYLHDSEDSSDERLLAIYDAAKQAMSQHIQGHFPTFALAEYSKVERAVRSVGAFYYQNRTTHGVATDFDVQASRLDNFPYPEASIEYGMRIAIAQKVGVQDVIARRQQLATLVSGLINPEDVIPKSCGATIVTDKENGVGQMERAVATGGPSPTTPRR